VWLERAYHPALRTPRQRRRSQRPGAARRDHYDEDTGLGVTSLAAPAAALAPVISWVMSEASDTSAIPAVTGIG
jgi:hypothetical protein